MELQRIEVGEPLVAGKINYQEASWLDYTESGPVLLIAVASPTAKEIEAIRAGKLQLALYEASPALWFLYKIQGFGPWSDCPFSIRIYDDRGLTFDWSEEIADGMGLGLQIILIDAGPGIVKVLRLVGMPTKFSRIFRTMILRQLERPFSLSNYHQEIDKTYARLTSDDLVDRADIKCRV